MSSTNAVTSAIELLLDEIQNDSLSGQGPIGQPWLEKVSPSVLKKFCNSAPEPAAPSLRTLMPMPKPVSTAKILIVDDDQFIVTFCQNLLWELGYENCLSLIDSTRAMTTILAERPDLIILDVMMPVLNGVDLLRMIRGHDELTHMPVLILTASSDRTTKATVLELGATDLLTKPIVLSELDSRVRKALTIKKHHDGHGDDARTLDGERVCTADLEASRSDAIPSLTRAEGYRHDDAVRQVEFVDRYDGIIGEEMGLDARICRILELAAQLHDVDQIGAMEDLLFDPVS